MRRISFLFLAFILLHKPIQAQDPLLEKIKQIEGIEIEALKPDEHFQKRYLLYISQPFDHKDSSLGIFRQRVSLGIREGATDMIFVTEGYSAEYAISGDYVYELSNYLNANQIVIEHRYYESSIPAGEPINWSYLTVENAAADHHRVLQLLKPLFSGKWISTGISKGGQATMFHRSLYPEDVDASVGYVCPLNFSDEDLRVYQFLENVGNADCRERVKAFQEMLLRNKNILLPAFIQEAKKQGLAYRMGYEAAFELLVMEYSFAFWQWGLTDCNQIPQEIIKPAVIISHLDSVSGLNWVDDGFLTDNPFFYQALTEIGMYGYDFSDFSGLITALKNNTFRFVCPEENHCEYNPAMMHKVDHYVRHEAKNFMFIYGEYDPWSATAVQWSGNPGVKVFFKPGGSHLSRIGNLPEEMKANAISTLKGWLGRN